MTVPPLEVQRFLKRDPWLAARRSCIGSSDALTIANERHKRSHHTLYSLWADKSGLVPLGESIDNRFTEWGNRLEPAVVEYVRDETGIDFIRRPYVILRRADKPHLGASPDAVAGPLKAPIEGLEVKCRDKKFADEWGATPPLDVQVQAQHQMAVTGLPRWHVAALLGGNDPRLYEVARDAKFCASLERAEDRFWQRVLDGKAPPMLGRAPEGSVLGALFPAETEGQTIMLPADAVEWHHTREAAIELLAACEEIVEEMRLRLIEAMGTAERGNLPDGSGTYYTLNTEKRKAYVRDIPAWSGRVLRSHDGKPTKPKKTKKGTVV